MKKATNKKGEGVGLVLGIGISLIVILICLIIGLLHIDRYRYNECLNNPPDTNYVEEDLEEVFLTTYVVVYDERQEEANIYYKVKANGLNYKVLYVMKHPDIGYYHWSYERHIEIREEIEEDLDYGF